MNSFNFSLQKWKHFSVVFKLVQVKQILGPLIDQVELLKHS